MRAAEYPADVLCGGMGLKEGARGKAGRLGLPGGGKRPVHPEVPFLDSIEKGLESEDVDQRGQPKAEVVGGKKMRRSKPDGPSSQVDASADPGSIGRRVDLVGLEAGDRKDFARDVEIAEAKVFLCVAQHMGDVGPGDGKSGRYDRGPVLRTQEGIEREHYSRGEVSCVRRELASRDRASPTGGIEAHHAQHAADVVRERRLRAPVAGHQVDHHAFFGFGGRRRAALVALLDEIGLVFKEGEPVLEVCPLGVQGIVDPAEVCVGAERVVALSRCGKPPDQTVGDSTFGARDGAGEVGTLEGVRGRGTCLCAGDGPSGSLPMLGHSPRTRSCHVS